MDGGWQNKKMYFALKGTITGPGKTCMTWQQSWAIVGSARRWWTTRQEAGLWIMMCLTWIWGRLRLASRRMWMNKRCPRITTRRWVTRWVVGLWTMMWSTWIYKGGQDQHQGECEWGRCRADCWSDKDHCHSWEGFREGILDVHPGL